MRLLSLALLTLLLLTTACQLGDVPEARPTIALPTVAVVANLPTPTATATLLPFPTPRPLQPPPSPTPLPTVTPVIVPALSVTTPGVGATVPVTAVLRVGGRVQAASDHRLEVAVVSLDGQLLAAAVVVPDSLNNWQVELELPTFLSGVAVVQASLYGADEQLLVQESTPITLLPDTASDRYLQLYRPSGIPTAVEGYTLFFDGYAQSAVRGLLTITILHQDCRTMAGRESYTLRGSGYWQAFLVMPAQLEGFTCAIISFGEVGQDGRREVHLPLNPIARTDPRAVQVALHSPTDGQEVQGGQQIILYGTAYNAPNDLVAITLLLEDGTLATAVTTTADRSGYWEYPLRVPTGITGPAQLTVGIGANTAEQTIFLQLRE